MPAQADRSRFYDGQEYWEAGLAVGNDLIKDLTSYEWTDCTPSDPACSACLKSGMTNLHRLVRAGHEFADAFYVIVVNRLIMPSSSAPCCVSYRWQAPYASGTTYADHPTWAPLCRANPKINGSYASAWGAVEGIHKALSAMTPAELTLVMSCDYLSTGDSP